MIVDQPTPKSRATQATERARRRPVGEAARLLPLPHLPHRPLPEFIGVTPGPAMASVLRTEWSLRRSRGGFNVLSFGQAADGLQAEDITAER